MLSLTLTPADENLSPLEIELEHSLVSVSKWEELFEKPFFGMVEKTPEEMTEYFRMMVVGELPEQDFIRMLRPAHVQQIGTYINSQRSGTTFRDTPGQRGGPQIVTSEQIYGWLVTFRIPFYPVEHWHINRMMNLIRIQSIANTKQKPISHAQRMEDQRALNAERKKQLGTTG